MIFLSEVATHLQNAEALHPAVAAQCKADRETRSWVRLPSTAQQLILTSSVADGLTIPLAPPPSIHRFLNAQNVTALQDGCALTYSGNNIFLPTALCQALLQGYILVIPNPNASTGLSPLLIPPYSLGPANA